MIMPEEECHCWPYSVHGPLQEARDSFSQQKLDAFEASLQLRSGKSQKADFDRLCSTVTQLAHKVDVLVARKPTATVSRPPPEEEY